MRTTLRKRSSRPLASLGLALLALTAFTSLRCSRPARGAGEPRVIILGLDGMDYGFASRLAAEGKMPGLARLAKMGGIAPLGSAVPPQSPVAWSDFITGMDAGGHGIFDFIHRDPATMTPYLSTSRTVGSTRTMSVGRWQFPLPPPLSNEKTELLRRGQAFWEVLEKKGIPTNILRIPANYPPSGTATRELSGMGTPDVLGGYGVFSFYTSDRFAFLDKTISGGSVYRIDVEQGVAKTKLYGPDNLFLVKPEKMTADFTIYVDPDRPAAKLVVGSEERVLQEGEWTDWIPVSFTMIPTQSLPAEVRFFLRRVRPELEIYASPINFDPMAPATTVSTPKSYATELARAKGRYYTQGMPENTGALSTGVLSPQEFLAQARLAGDEILDEFPYVLSRFDRGLLFYYIGNLDLVSHMMWRAMDPEHPGYDPAVDVPLRDVVAKKYEALDGLITYALDHMPEGTLLVVMSDHGFTSWRRVFNLNAWLHENGYLTVKDESLPEHQDMFRNVDWSKTRAYGLGLNGLYLNLKGRERDGIVPPEQRESLAEEIAAKLEATLDPKTGQRAVSHAYLRDKTYSAGAERSIGPDIVMGYAKGTRSSDESALGDVGREVLSDNMKMWSGDHCMDAPDVPGILATNRPLKRPVTRLNNLAAAVLAEFGVESFPTQGPAAGR